MHLNRLSSTSFNSASLSGFASIAHPLREPGHWRLEAHGFRVTPNSTIDIVVRDEGKARVAIDLAQPAQGNDCCNMSEPLLALNGMLNLGCRSLRGGAYALLYRGSGDDAVWDSRVLEPGDNYACMPFRPGQYLIENLLGDARASVRVNYPDPRKTALGLRLASEPVQLKVGRTITPDELLIDPGQVLVFAIEANSHLVVTLEEPDDGHPDLAEWRAAHSRQALEATFARRSTN